MAGRCSDARFGADRSGPGHLRASTQDRPIRAAEHQPPGGCSERSEPPTENAKTVETSWADCEGGTAITFIKAIDKGHTWYTSDPDDRAVT
jgi:poly(3-hydroxybutyrate) depolymerase